MTRLAPELCPASEKEIEDAINALFLRYGWYPLKTDAGQVTRGGSTRKRGHIESGFPDMVYLLALPGTALCLAALVETKTEQGKLRPSQVATHAKLRQQYGLAVHIVRDAAEARTLIVEARFLVGALKAHKVPQVDP